jgi:hypothetical protein
LKHVIVRPRGVFCWTGIGINISDSKDCCFNLMDLRFRHFIANLSEDTSLI